MPNDLQPPARIDGLIPAFNAGRTVEASVRSICNQTFRYIRIIVVYDASTDETPQILRRLAHEDRRIEVITTRNRGIVDALNTGLQAVRADLIARFDADDMAYPQRLAVQRAYLQQNPDCVAVGCNVHFIHETDRRTGKHSYFSFRGPCDPYFAPAMELYLPQPFFFVRPLAMEQTGDYRYAFHTEDTDLDWRLGDIGELISLGQAHSGQSLHARSVSTVSLLHGQISVVILHLAGAWKQLRNARMEAIGCGLSTLAECNAAWDVDKFIAFAARQLMPWQAFLRAVAELIAYAVLGPRQHALSGVG